MILSDREIWAELESHNLIIEPSPDPDQVQPSSIDLTLSNQFTRFNIPRATSPFVDLAQGPDIEEIIEFYGDTETLSPGGYFDLQPTQFVLSYTKEYIELPSTLAGRIEGRSSIGRLGISIHKTAPTIHPKFKGQLRLEIQNNGPFLCRLREGVKMCQLILERVGIPSDSSQTSVFQGQRQ